MLKLRQMGTCGVQKKGVLPWLVCWVRRAVTRDFYSALVALVGPIQNIFFLTFFVSIASNLGRLVPSRLSLNRCLWV
jgi:hypothetical protein